MTWIGSPAVVGAESRSLAGDALYGTYGVTDIRGKASPPPAASRRPSRESTGKRLRGAAAWSYDAMRVFGEVTRKLTFCDEPPETAHGALPQAG